MYAGLKIKNKTIFFQYIGCILKYLQNKLQAHSIAVGPNFFLQQIFLIFIYKIKELVLPFIRGGGRKTESENKEINNKIEVTCIYKPQPPPKQTQ